MSKAAETKGAGERGWMCDGAVRRGTEGGSCTSRLPASRRTDVSLRLKFPLRVYSSVNSPPSPGDFMPPEQPKRGLCLSQLYQVQPVVDFNK